VGLFGHGRATESLPPGRELVVIDPGHGGANRGAAGRGGLHEKQVTLAVAQRLKRLLVERGFRVVLTRESDRYLTLRDRVRRGNAVEPFAFISLHANASPDHSQRGVETFVLDRAVAEVESRRLARRAGGPVAALLADLRMSHQLRESIRLGRAIQESLVQARGAADRGLRQADYDVLSGITAPAVLVEMGFIDHVVEGPLLSQPDVQEQIAEAIVSGLLRFMVEAPAPPTEGRRSPPSRDMAQAASPL
jgi:N-acetylmuramoyl-L-alanine amidase